MLDEQSRLEIAGIEAERPGIEYEEEFGPIPTAVTADARAFVDRPAASGAAPGLRETG
jgi:hypothetical protein